MSIAPYVVLFVLLSAACGYLYYKNAVSASVAQSAEFKAFQYLFLVVYLTMIMADWLQGPYVYALYKEYGFTSGEIGILFVVGFGSSLIFGTIIGGFADRFGRKLNCLLFAVLYGLSCMTKHFNSFAILLIGRLLGGVATSILFSAFETWMIHQHKAQKFPEDWIGSTFSLMTFWGSLLAIISGLLAYCLAAVFGSVAPFDASLVLLIGGGLFVYYNWKENYGAAGDAALAAAAAGGSGGGSAATDAATAASGGGAGGLTVVGSPLKVVLELFWEAFSSFPPAFRLLITKEQVLLLGVVQSCFESSMYIFVFLWTPALEKSLEASYGEDAKLPHGIVFALFMVAVMIGSKLFEALAATGRTTEDLGRWLIAVACVALAVPIFTDNHILQLLGFCIFEVACGIYFPSFGKLRSRYIPESVRSTVMNIFRMGMNFIVVITLVNIDAMAHDTVFLFCVILLTLAVLAQHRLHILNEAGGREASSVTAEEREEVAATGNGSAAAVISDGGREAE